MEISKKSITIVLILIFIIGGLFYFKNNYRIIQKVELNSILMSASSDDTNLDYSSKNFISKQIKTTTLKKALKIAPEKIIKNDKLYLIHSLAKQEDKKMFTAYYKLVN